MPQSRTFSDADHTPVAEISPGGGTTGGVGTDVKRPRGGQELMFWGEAMQARAGEGDGEAI